MTDISAAKFALRKAMLAMRAAVVADQRETAGAALAAHAPELVALAAGGVISGFSPFRDEIDTMPLMVALARLGQRLALPRVEGPHLVFHRWAPGEALVIGRYGLPEPEPETPVVVPDMMLVPMLAFDREGNRIGYGAGFFDRVLADYPVPLTIGLAFALQESASVPVEPHDQPLDMVLTEAGLIDCRAGSRD